MRFRHGALQAAVYLVMLSVGSVSAGQTSDAPQEQVARSGPSPAAGGPRADEDAPPPVAPAVVTRDDQGRVTVRAVRINEPLKLDGRLDEEIYRTTLAMGDFIQQERYEGAPATEKTDVWVFFDDKNLYVGARCWDSQPASHWIVDELRRDSNNITRNENFVVILDTFHDRRNGFFFQTNPLGAMREQTFTDERIFNPNWNPVWDTRSGRFEGGWTAEMVIPFKSIRYRGSGAQVWGINFRRIVAWKNETSHLTLIPVSYGNPGVMRASRAATMVGLETPGESMNLELKPYAISALTTDLGAADSFRNRLSKNIGFDFKYGLTRGLIADATYNTDFAQVEEDVQQVNLTRFSVQFPEKRDFFLEGQGVFNFGGQGGGDVPIPFFSRQIGTSKGQSVPVVAGGRLTGTVGKYGIGLLNVQTDDQQSAGAVATNFSVVRVKRNILRGSNIGLLATRRTPATRQDGSNLAMGADANFAFFRNLAIASSYVRTDSPGASGDESSYRGRFDYAADRYGLQLEHLLVGDAFNPEVGFTRRKDFRRSTIAARFSPRPKASRFIRRLNWNVSYDYITDGKQTRVENRQATANFQTEFHNSDFFSADYTRDYEYLPKEFEIAPQVILPIGGYDYGTFRLGYTLGSEHRVSGRVGLATGSFYEGTKREATFSTGRVILTSRLSLEPGITLDWVDLPQGRFQARLITARAIFANSPRSLINGLVQYNPSDHTVSSSMRLRWEYQPGSELFIVYSDGRNTAQEAVSALVNRSFVIKITRLFRF